METKKFGKLSNLEEQNLLELAQDEYETAYTHWCEAGEVTEVTLYHYGRAEAWLWALNQLTDDKHAQLQELWADTEFYQQIERILQAKV